MGLFDDLIPDAPSSTGLFDDLLPKKGNAVADALKHDQDFQPTPEELSSGYKARMSLPDPGAIWKGAKTLATETIPAQWSKSQQQIADEGVPQFWNPSKFRGQAETAAATLGETALRGTAYLGDMLKTPLDAAIGEAAAEAQSPGNAMLRAAQMALGMVSGVPLPVSQRTPEQQSAAEQIWASRMRVAGKDERAMAPYHEGDKTFVPGALGAPAEFASNFVDPTMAVPALKAAGLLKLAGKGAEAASMAGRLSNVAKEAANTGGIVKKAAEVAAPAIEKGAQLAGEGLDKVATGLDKVQPVLDVGGLVKGGLPGAAGAHVVGRGVRAGVKWASKVRDASTGVRNIAKADWNSTWTVAQQLAKDSDAPVWLQRAASSSVAPMVESTIRGAGAVGEGALHGAAIGGAASMANDTLTPEERGEFIGGGAVLGGGGAALGKGLGAVTGRNAQARQAHEWAVMAHEAIQSGAEPSTVLGASDATMSYAHSLKQLFKGAMPGGKDLTVRLMDGNQFAEAHPNEPTAVGSFVSSPDGTHEVRLNLDRPDADSRALHEGLGHALMESVVGNTPDAFERARAVFSPDEINTAAQQYATALHPELKGPDQQTWIAQQQANSTLRWGDRDAWILSELISEGAVQEAGGRSIRDMATPGFGSSLQRTLGRDKPFKVETASFFSGDVAAKLKSPELGQLVRGRVEQLGQFRPGIDEPKGNSVVVQKGDWGKKPFAPLHDLAKAPAQPPPLPRDPSQPPPLNPQPPTPAPQVPKGNDFVVVNPTTGAVVARPPAQTRELVKNRQKAVDAAVPRDGTPASPGDVDPQVKFRTSPSGLVERAGTVLGKWFYDGNVFSETTKGYARKIEDAIKNGAALSGFYHEIGESAKGWAKSVGERYGNLTAEYKDFIPVGFLVSTAGNLLVRNYSLTAFERKAQTWGARKGVLSLELWNGDVGTFKSDVQTYLKNHSEGRPGADGIGEQKRNVINAFLVGGNRSFEATNPLRPFAKGADREGIIRSYRLDRLETVEPSDITGFSQPKYEQQLRNLSPKTEQFSPKAGDKAYMKAVENKDLDAAKRMVELAAKKAGYGPDEVVHGTTHMFTVFTKDRSNIGNDFGKGHYFSNTPDDVAANYAGEGPDLTNRIEQLAEQLESNEDMSPEEARAAAKKRLKGSEDGRVIKAYVRLENPAKLGGKDETRLNTEFSDEDAEPTGSGPDFLKGLEYAARQFDDVDGQQLVSDVLDNVGGMLEGQPLREVLEAAKEFIFATDPETGDSAGNELLRSALEHSGYDGIIDRTVNEKFGTKRKYGKGMNGVYPDTYHVIAFDSNQIKSSDPVTYDDKGKVIPLSKRFDPTNPDIRYSPKTLSEETISSTLPRNEEDTSRRLPIGRFRVDPATDGQTFAEAIRRTKTEHPFGFAVDDKGDGFYGDTGSKLFLAQDKLAGVAVTDYGDLVSVFKHPESTADIRPILAEASQHALTLDAFDVNGFLPNLYAQFGFRPVARVAFNREFAPPGWRYDLAGEPDVVLMVKDPKGISGAPAVSKDYSTVKTQVPSVDYDTAVRLQAEAKARVAAQVQFSPQVPLEPTPEYLERTPGARVYAAKLVDGAPHKYVNISVAKKDTSVAKNALEGASEKRSEFYQRLDGATKKVAQDPVRLSNPKGYVEYMRDAGVSGDVMAPPAILKTLIETPQKYVDLVMGGYHGDKTKPGSLEAAMGGLDSTLEMRKAIGEKPPALISALHHFWGILSRQATPLDQEGAWLRLISQPEVLDHIQKSIDGTFELTDTEWDGVVSRGMKASAQSSNRIGNAVTSNANSFYLMLNRWNGKWDRVSDIYAAPNSIEMGRRFWAMGEGPVGIKNKVQRFVGLTFGTPGLIMDRWKFVEFYMGQFGKEPRDFFEYSATGTPGDPASLYAAYGGVESSNPVLSLAFYEGMETALGKAIENSAELKQLLGRHANVGGLHWVGWNAIKNEAVGHSSLNMTYDLARKTSDPKPQDVLELLEKNEYFTEGLSGNTLRRFSLKDKK